MEQDVIPKTPSQKERTGQDANEPRQASGRWRRAIVHWLPPLLPFRYQLLGHLTAGLVLSLLLTLALGPFDAKPAGKSAPFITHAGMLAVTVAVYPEAPPEIIAVRPLAEGRVTETQPGDHTLSILDRQDAVLYSFSFQPTFTIPGLGRHEENRLIFVVPNGNEAERVVVSGPQGEASHLLSDRLER